MTWDPSIYPENWDDVRRKILLRAGGEQEDPRKGSSCEFCEVINYSVGRRDDAGTLQPVRGTEYLDGLGYAVSYAEARKVANSFCHATGYKYIVVVLTVAHLEDPDPHNTADDNLAALCQRCHNIYDARMMSENAKATKAAKAERLAELAIDPQLGLFED